MIKEGWYIPKSSRAGASVLPRWVLGNRDGLVVYGKGGTGHYCCKEETFDRWLKRNNAQLAPTRASST